MMLVCQTAHSYGSLVRESLATVWHEVSASYHSEILALDSHIPPNYAGVRH